MNETAVRYADALYALTGDAVTLLASADLLTETPALWAALCSPVVRPRAKRAVLARIPELTGVLLHFYQLLADRGRLTLLPEICAAFVARALREQNKAVCVMRCARLPDQASQDKLCQTLCTMHHRDKVLLEITVDPTLLGGFTLDIDGMTYDRSVKGQLDALARRLAIQEGRIV